MTAIIPHVTDARMRTDTILRKPKIPMMHTNRCLIGKTGNKKAARKLQSENQSTKKVGRDERTQK